VTYLYRSVQDAQAATAQGGTGFVVSVPSATVPDRHFFYVVTASHVIEGGANVVRLNDRAGTTRAIAIDPDDWEHLPNDDVAIAGLPVDPIVDDWKSIPTEMFVTREIIEEFDIGPGDEVFMCGRFSGQEGADRNTPSVRLGSIAQMDAPGRHPRGFTQEGLLVEMRSLSQYSGSPVIVYVPRATPRPKPAARFYWGRLGLDWGHIPYEELVRDTNREALKGETAGWHVRTNSGMARVLPAWRIREHLESESFSEGRAKVDREAPPSAEASPIGPVEPRRSGGDPTR
jgi:hypothetical protein